MSPGFKKGKKKPRNRKKSVAIANWNKGEKQLGFRDGERNSSTKRTCFYFCQGVKKKGSACTRREAVKRLCLKH